METFYNNGTVSLPRPINPFTDKKQTLLFQSTVKTAGLAHPYQALKVFARPSSLQGGGQDKLLVALALNHDGSVAWGGPLLDNVDDEDDQGNEDDDDKDDETNDGDDDDKDHEANNGDDDDKDDDVKIVHELICID